MNYAGVYLMGGLGNQLFQYLFALKLSQRSDLSVVLLLDWFQGNQLLKRAADRPLQITQVLQPALPMTTLGLSAESGVIFSKLHRFEQQGGMQGLDTSHLENTLCMGYYQRAQAMPSRAVLENCLRQIGASDFSTVSQSNDHLSIVALHVRLGDYLKLQHLLPVLPVEYYAKALRRLPHAERYLVFAENAQEAADFLQPIAGQFAFEFVPPGNPADDFCKLASMPAVIGANSTFSLLAGWAARLRGARVVMPVSRLWHGAGHDADIAGKQSLLELAEVELVG
jgi:hypothetical protein